MDVKVSSPPVEESLQKDNDSLKINEPEVADEEDEFYDAGEDVSHNSSDSTPLDLNFSIANEDLLTGSNTTGANRAQNPQMENLDDISTDAASNENDSPKSHQLRDDIDHISEEISQNTQSLETEHNEMSTSQFLCQDEDDRNTTNYEGTSETVPSQNDCVLIIKNNSRSSMEVMEDDSDFISSKSSSVVKVVSHSDVMCENFNADVVDNFAEDGSACINENISTSVTPLDSECTEKLKTNTSDMREILAIDDSDVDESLQENLHVALKVVEDSSHFSPAPNKAKKIETLAENNNFTNNLDNLQPKQEASQNTKKILEEFRGDVAQINGDTSEVVDNRLCPCQVVLFRIDFDEYALKHLQNNTESVQSLNDLRTDSNSDRPNTVETLPLCKSRVLTKAARKMMILPEESFKKRQEPRARGSCILPTNLEYAERPRRKTRDTKAQTFKHTSSTSDSSESEDDKPLNSFSKTSKVNSNCNKRSARIVKKSSYSVPMLSQKKDYKEKKNFENELSVEPTCQKTLKCVSVPIITDLIESLKDKSCRELIELVEAKTNVLPSQTISTITKRRRTLSSSDTSKLSVGDDEYKTSIKMWKCVESSAKEANSISLRSKQALPCKRSPRKSAKVRNYIEYSESDDDDSPSKKMKKCKTNLTHVKCNKKKYTDSSDEEAENSSSETDSRFPRRRSAASVSSRSRNRV